MSDSPTLIVNDKPRTLTEVIRKTTLWPQEAEKTIIVICHRQSHLLEQLSYETISAAEAARSHRRRNRLSLARPTLNFLKAAQKVRLVYCSNLLRFRAFLTTLPIDNDDEIGAEAPARIVIVDMLALHYGTSEFTIQGLCRSLAMVASVQHDIQCHVELVECTDVRDSADPGRGHPLWDTQVPLLSSSIKIGDIGKQWASRSTKIRDFADRWFDFVKEDQQ